MSIRISGDVLNDNSDIISEHGSISNDSSDGSFLLSEEPTLAARRNGSFSSELSAPLSAKLAEVEMPSPLSSQQSVTTRPFCSLRRLRVRMMSTEVPALITILSAAGGALTDLFLRAFVDETPNARGVKCSSEMKQQQADLVLPAVAQLTQLRRLEVQFATCRAASINKPALGPAAEASVVFLKNKDIVGLNRLTQLRSLTLRGCCVYNPFSEHLVSAPDFDRAALRDLLEPFAHLEQVWLELAASPLPYDSCMALGNVCCVLRDVGLRRVLANSQSPIIIRRWLLFDPPGQEHVAPVRMGTITGYPIGPDFW
jgi:hypothetical protein